ncbi:MAG: stage III sporulation protein AD [Clostridiales bacterium]|nr:stage III sporulation protein AD [Clostridiales bacterium]
MLKVGLFAIAAAFLGLILKKEKEEFAVLLILAAGVLLFSYALAQVAVVITFVQDILDGISFDWEYMTVLLKMLGIAYVGEFAASVCQDAGYHSVAGQAQMFAKLSVVILSLPYLAYFVEVVEGFL